MEHIINRIDPKLGYIKTLKKEGISVCKVGMDNSNYVLKGAFPFEWEMNHLASERKRLIQADNLKSGINHFVKYYGNFENYRGLFLRTFFEGTSLTGSHAHLTNTNLQKKLETTVNELHERGIAGLDLTPKNIAISPDGKDICIIDLGCLGSYKGELNEETLEVLKEIDYKNLKDYIFD